MRRFRTLALIIIALVAPLMVFGPTASALSGSEFEAERIIDDSVFFNPGSMSAGQIQSFLNSKVPNCDTNGSQPYGGTTRAAYAASRGYPAPFTCLKDYSVDVPAKAADTYCGPVGAGRRTAAEIIFTAAQACGVSPKVLIVLLQKEQSLITDDWPWAVQYEKATGYGCPDTAPCDPGFAGLFNQLYYGARQYKRYARQPEMFNYAAGRTSFVAYQANNPGCGGTNLTMRGSATAGLYNYTPYQPNAAALNNLYGTGDACSAYGNRNFWRMFSDWFGSTRSNIPYSWAYEGQGAYTNSQRTQEFTSIPTTGPNSVVYVRVKARNTGTQTWSQSTTRIAPSRPMDTPSVFAGAGWISNTRASALLESSVSPGQTGTFEFRLNTPSTPGTYKQYFNVLIEGREWLNDLGLYFTVNVANSTSAPNSSNITLASGQTLTNNRYLMSPDAQSVLSLREGNLVLFSNLKKRWEVGVNTANRLVMQTDGNLVLYNNGQALWASGTNGNPGARLVMQTDGNMVIYSSGNQPLWASYTIHIPEFLSYAPTTFDPGRLFPGQAIQTADRRLTFILQDDGNLVLYAQGRGAVWASGTDGRNVAYLAMQPDGNLVLYDANRNPIWYSGSSGYGPSRLIAQQDGNLVIYSYSADQPIWNTETSGSL